MTFKPAHKDTDTPPGQIVNPIERSKTIGGIVDRVMRSEALPIKQKLTFDEWWQSNQPTTNQYDSFMSCWDAAQENK